MYTTIVVMRAIRQHTLGGPEVLVVEEVPKPEPGPTEVLVRVAAAGVNPVDWKVRAGGGFLGDPPFTVGWDVAGTVEAVGFGVTWLAPGDRVFGMPRFPREAACYAEYVVSPSRHLARTPDGLSDVEASAVPLAGLTAWQSLVDTAGVGEGSRVLVLGAAGGVGHLAVQIARARGAWVAGTSSAAKHGFLRELGVDELLDRDEPISVRDVDVVLDCGGRRGRDRQLACAARRRGARDPLGLVRGRAARGVGRPRSHRRDPGRAGPRRPGGAGCAQASGRTSSERSHWRRRAPPTRRASRAGRAEARAHRLMARFVLVHGAFGGAWCWQPVIHGLEAAGPHR
jgi:D-arabinose 1-dehydrogenase-like Zn-dependent alcohol dehydrogenase